MKQNNTLWAVRNNTIEECAQVAERHLARYDHMEHVAGAIRALKDKSHNEAIRSMVADAQKLKLP